MTARAEAALRRDESKAEKLRDHHVEEEEKAAETEEEEEVGPTPDQPVRRSEAPPALQRNKSVACPSAFALAQEAMAAAAPPQPTLTAALQYATYGMHREHTAKALLTATPAPGADKPKEAHIVFALDESLSMGGVSMDLLKQFMSDLVKKGVPGIDLYMRILFFGGEVVDKKLDTVEMLCLNDASRSKFAEIIDTMDARQGSTDIHQAVMAGIDICQAHRSHLEACPDGTYIPPAMHVVCLTDGCANHGITSAGALRTNTLEKVVNDNIFVHYIGLGIGVQPRYMTKATDSGCLGVFSSAADASKLPNAFEEVFGFTMQTRNSFTVKITDADGERVQKHGMLIKERGVVVDVKLRRSDEETTLSGVKCQLLDRGHPIGDEVVVDASYAGVEPGEANQAVADALMRKQVEAKALEIMRESGSIRRASERLQEYTDTLASEGASVSVLQLMRHMTAGAVAAVGEYEQMSQQDEGAASQMYSARSATVSQYY